jgi:hypothetical protein
VASITHEDICVVVEQLKSRLVELGTGVGLSDGKTNSVSKTLAERAGGHLNTLGVVGLWVTWGKGVDVLKIFVNTIQKIKK